MADAVQFKPGDVVRLKSGGPSMTVSLVTQDDVYCQWYENDNGYRGDHFVPVVLEAVF